MIEQVPPELRVQVVPDGKVTLPVPDCDHEIGSPVMVPPNDPSVAVHVELDPIGRLAGHEMLRVVCLST